MFQRLVASDTITKPALILVDESESDPQLSYIINDPEYQNAVLVARLPETPEEIIQLQLDFPNRSLYRFDPQTFSVTPVNVR